MSQEARRHDFPRHVHAITRDGGVVGTAHGFHHGQMHPREDHSCCLDQVPPTEWSLRLRVSDSLCEVFGCPHIDLFATRANAKLPLYVLLFPDLMVWKQRFSTSMG